MTGPSAACLQEQAFLSLSRLIRRKKTHLEFQTIQFRLNTYFGERLVSFRLLSSSRSTCRDTEFLIRTHPDINVCQV